MAKIGKTHTSSVLLNVFDNNTFEIKMSKDLEISKVYSILCSACDTIEAMMEIGSEAELEQFTSMLKH